MTFSEIEAFLAVIEYGTISAAAQNLYITQPALTRRIQTLESDLGYALFERRKGSRSVQLTNRGKEFYRIAWKWKDLLLQTSTISAHEGSAQISVATIGSVYDSWLPEISEELIRHDYYPVLYTVLSEHAYQQMNLGFFDLALIEMQEYTINRPSGIQIHPAYSEVMLAASAGELPLTGNRADLQNLDPAKEIYLPWNSSFKKWHADHFDETRYPAITLEGFSSRTLLHYLRDDRWAFVSYTAAEVLKHYGIHIYELSVSPPDQVIYYLIQDGHQYQPGIQLVLQTMNRILRRMPADKIHCFLPDIPVQNTSETTV